MKVLPFLVQKFAFRDDPALEALDWTQPYLSSQANKQILLLSMEDGAQTQAKAPGYFVMSSAPPNIEEALETKESDIKNANLGIREMAAHLHDMDKTCDEMPELVIAVHGYNTSRSSVEDWYRDIFHYVNRYDQMIPAEGNCMLIGYRWPSEKIAIGTFPEVIRAFDALPPLPRKILVFGGICAIALLILNLLPFGGTAIGVLVSMMLALLMVVGALMLALVVMRLVVYFRDRYRANNFGVLDLVELLRQLDRELVNLTAEDFLADTPAQTATAKEDALKQARDSWQSPQAKKVRLSFIGHSMGGFVVTNVVRILSDVFDTRSVDKAPPSDVGTVFRLERLILASPDIPVLTIISSRANFLASSLRRFAESYLFSSEGDIALRIASTAANYIAFPSQTQSHGYRLGNVSLIPNDVSDARFGINNLHRLDSHYKDKASLHQAIASDDDKILEHLFVTRRQGLQGGYETLARLFNQQVKKEDEGRMREQITVADFFTFFDCTDYSDVKFSVADARKSHTPTGVLTRATAKSILGFLDYLQLTLDYGLGRRDVHGGYFEGEFSQFLLYRLAFLGFSGYLKALDDDINVSLTLLHQACRERQIQVFLSPFRYWCDVLGYDLETTKRSLLEVMQDQTHRVLR